jgi:hypothetical protein
MATDITPPANGARNRRRWVAWGALLVLIVVVGFSILHPDVRALVRATVREMFSIAPGMLAIIVALRVGQALLSTLSWFNALRTAWPRAGLSYRFVLGIDQGQDIVNAVAPGRAGTWAMLGVIDVSIPGARIPKLLTVWGVQNLAFILFASINYVLVAIGIPDRPQEQSGVIDRASGFVSSQPLVTAAIGVLLLVFVFFGARLGRRKLGEVRHQVREGVAILGTPSRYVRLLFLPALGSYAFRCASTGVLLAAFDIPVTLWTLSLALGSQAVAGAVRVTPAGLGTTQAIDVVALSPYAPPEVVTAFSLAQIAIMTIVNSAVAVVALISINDWRRNLELLGHLRRGDLSAGLHSLAAHQRARRNHDR